MGPRLPDRTRLGAVRLQVADLERSIRYYTGVLGFGVLERGDGQASLGAGQTSPSGSSGASDTSPGRQSPSAITSPLIELHERPGAAPGRKRLGLFHYAILLPDRAALGRLAAHLGESGVRAGASDHLVSEALYLQDPDQLGIEVYADRPRAHWRSRNGELLMDTRPLDLRGLVSAAGGEAWSGMPGGTTIGHVHLHVGDLSRAASLYHEALGLDVTVRSYPGALFLSAGGYHHHLGLNTWAGPDAKPTAEGDARLLEWEMLLPDAAAAEAAARAEGAGHRVRPDGDDWLVTDPWGTTVRLASAGLTEQQA